PVGTPLFPYHDALPILDGAFYPSNFVWNTDAGVEGNYNVAQPEAAAEDLKAAGYNGEPLRILTSRQYEFHYKMAQVAAEYLKLADRKSTRLNSSHVKIS